MRDPIETRGVRGNYDVAISYWLFDYSWFTKCCGPSAGSDISYAYDDHLLDCPLAFLIDRSSLLFPFNDGRFAFQFAPIN